MRVYTTVIPALFAVIASGCADTSAQNFLGPATAVTATVDPVVVVNPTPTPTPSVPDPCRGIHNTIHEASPDGLSIRVKNLCLDGTPKEYVFALFRVAGDGTQTRLSMTSVLLPAGHDTVLTLTLPGGTCPAYQTDLFTEITEAQVLSGEAKINPNEEGQPGYVNPLYGKVFKTNACETPRTCEQDNHPTATIRPFVTSYPLPYVLYRDVQLYNAGLWSVRLLSADSVTKYNNNTPDYVNDFRVFKLSCGDFEHTQVTFANWGAHPSPLWWVEVSLNGVFHSKGDYVTNVPPNTGGDDLDTGEVPQGDIPTDKPDAGVR